MRNLLADILKRWSREQEAAFSASSQRKSLADRIGGYHKLKRVGAKFLLLGTAPLGLLALGDALGLTPWGGLAWSVGFWASVVWLSFVVGVSYVSLWRGLRRAQKPKT